VLSLSTAAGVATLAIGYFVCMSKLSLPSSQVFGLMAFSAAGLIVTASVTEWMDQ
jgi:uncharacterized membrane protein (UPF0136 family)